MPKNNIIKVIGTDGCKDCDILFNLIDNYVKHKNLNIKIEKIQSISNESIDLAIEFEINKIPFAIFNNKKIVFDEKTNRSNLKDFFK